MEVIQIGLFIIFCLYCVPFTKYIYSRTRFAVKLKSAIRKYNLKKYGHIAFASQDKTSFYIETETKLYAVIQFRRFYKYMIYFNRKGSAMILHIGIRRFLPFKPFYNVNVSDLDFRFKYEELPISARQKEVIPVFLMNPAPKGVTVPSPYEVKEVVQTGVGEHIENFFITNASFLIRTITNDTDLYRTAFFSSS